MEVMEAAPVPTSAPPLPTPPEDRGVAQPGAKRLLLLDDDLCFREVIRDFLAETGYTVVAVESGIDGIREVIAADFSIVLCDMNMPGLQGDLFYRAVERARPQLCDRFVFMTGLRGDATANDFIVASGGHALLKPFTLQQLLHAIGEMERRRVLREMPAPRSVEPARAIPEWAVEYPAPASRDPAPAVAPHSSSPAEASRQHAATAPMATAPVAVEGDATPHTWITKAVAMALVAMAVLFYLWHQHADGERAAARQELHQLEARWPDVAGELEKARAEGAHVGRLADRAGTMVAEYHQTRWSNALQRIVACSTAPIELRGIRIRPNGTDGGAWTVSIAARCAGSRMEADTYRRRIQHELEKAFDGVVATRFSEMEDLPPTAGETAEGAGVTFSLLATIGPADQPTPTPE